METSPVAGGRPAFTVVAFAGSCVAFVVIGAFQAVYGPAIPEVRARYGVGLGAAGFSLSAHFAGALLGVLAFHLGRGRLSNRRLLGGSYLLMAAGGLAFATAPTWPLALAGTFVVGLGFGGVDYGLNQLVAVGFGRRSPAMLNLLNAHFGVGAVVGPALIGWLGAGNYPGIVAGLSLTCLAIMATLGGVAATRPAAAGAEPAKVGGPRVWPIVAAFVGVYVLHVAIETGVGGWEPTHLAFIGYPAAVAATATSGYWLAMTVGRFAVIPVSLRWSASQILLGCCVGIAGFSLLAAVPAVAPLAYLGVGLAIAPIFPTCLPWLTRAVPSVAAAGAYVIAASMVGGVVFPPLLGSAIDLLGVGALPAVLGALAVGCAALAVWLHRTVPDRDVDAVAL